MTTSTVVVGSGAAGLSAALGLTDRGIDVTVITDRALGASNSVMARGGLHVPLDSRDSEKKMAQDMRASGGPAVRTELIDPFVSRVRPAIAELERWGLQLDRNEKGHLRRRIAGGMTEPRIVGVGDSIGAPLIRLMTQRLRASPNATVLEHTAAERIEPASANHWQTHSASGATIRSKRVIVATGGATHRWATRHNIDCTNPQNHNQTGVTMLDALELETVDRNLFQFQPFGIVDSRSATRPVQAIPETIVEYPVELLDATNSPVVAIRAGRRSLTAAAFAARDGDRLVRSPGGQSGLVLTLSRLNADQLGQLPKMVKTLRRLGLADDTGADDVIVFPAAHYQLGGFVRAADGSTSFEGLYLAGEVSGGLHGHDRLMGNGLTESIVTGMAAADAVSRSLKSI